MKRIDLSGKRFGRLTVISAKAVINGHLFWTCICDCGRKKDVAGQKLRNGEVGSCGCLYRDSRTSCRTTHGGSRWPEYRVWKAMRERCEKSYSSGYAMYGAKGIRVCRRWKKFENFIADMGRRPTNANSLERVDGAKGYSPSNCRWATHKDQVRNRSNTIVVTINGVTAPLAQFGERHGLKWQTIYIRYRRGKRGKDLIVPIA